MSNDQSRPPPAKQDASNDDGQLPPQPPAPGAVLGPMVSLEQRMRVVPALPAQPRMAAPVPVYQSQQQQGPDIRREQSKNPVHPRTETSGSVLTNVPSSRPQDGGSSSDRSSGSQQPTKRSTSSQPPPTKKPKTRDYDDTELNFMFREAEEQQAPFGPQQELLEAAIDVIIEGMLEEIRARNSSGPEPPEHQ